MFFYNVDEQYPLEGFAFRRNALAGIFCFSTPDEDLAFRSSLARIVVMPLRAFFVFLLEQVQSLGITPDNLEQS